MSLGMGEILVILIIAYVIVGPEDLPKILQAVKKGLRQMKSLTGSVQESLKQETGLEDVGKAIQSDMETNDLLAELKAIQHEIKSNY